MTTKRLVKISYFTMLTILGGLVRIPIPGTPILFTLQTLFVILSGLVLGPYDGAFSQIAYMVLGLIGLPVFSSGGGIQYVFMPSFGYILSFWMAAAVSGLLVRRLRTLSTLKIFACALAGVFVNYAVGISYQVFAIMFLAETPATFAAAIATVPSVLIMLVKDMILLYLVCLIYPRLMSMMRISTGKPLPSADLPVLSAPPREPDGEENEEKKKKKGKEKPPLPEPAGCRRPEELP